MIEVRTDGTTGVETMPSSQADQPAKSSSRTIFYNAHHSPMGAFATLTFGCKGPLGGLGIELKGPADENLFVGIEDRDQSGRYRVLPFCSTASVADESEDYDVEGLSDFQRAPAVSPFADDQVSRRMGASLDEWQAGDLTFRVISPVYAVPDPDVATDEELRNALAPAIVAELTLDNRQGARARKAFFGYAGSERSSAMRVWREEGVVGVGQGTSTAIGTADEGVYAGIAWQPEAVLDPRYPENLPFILGSTGLLVGTVPAGEVRTFRFAIGFFREGTATTGLATRYLYRRWFDRAEDVVRFALGRVDESLAAARAFDAKLSETLTPDRALMAAHAIRSYVGATQCLELPDGRPFWVVNEGEYRMMNTFDLTVDQAFFELAMNPWTLRNELDFFVERYAYEDQVRFPGDPTLHPGGIAFTHDMGIGNVFSEPGHSGYEQAGLRGCFSYMSCEELVNWALCACMYVNYTGDAAWAEQRKDTFLAVLQSLLNRDHPEPGERNGVMGLDGARCQGGAEITTYDSLDASLGQARNNLYLAVKCWAAYLLLEKVYQGFGDVQAASTALDQARKCAATIVSAVDEEGYLPAVLGEGVEARIIPAIEGLVYPYLAGCPEAVSPEGPFGELREVLQRHFELVLRPGTCLFPDGGWKLSSTSRNSWLSKIYLCQFVAERIFGHEPDVSADQAHLGWLMAEENIYYAWSDQMLQGRAVGSRYYPRGVTSALWLAPGDGETAIGDIGRLLRSS